MFFELEANKLARNILTTNKDEEKRIQKNSFAKLNLLKKAIENAHNKGKKREQSKATST